MRRDKEIVGETQKIESLISDLFRTLERRISVMECTLKKYGNEQFSKIRAIESDLGWVRKWRCKLEKYGDRILWLIIVFILGFFFLLLLKEAKIVTNLLGGS